MYLLTKLKHYREINSYSQADISKILEITQQQYSKLEIGKSIVNASQLIILSKFYNCTPNDLLDFTKSI